ncbi:MAG: ABC transporter permease [Candidatus Cloacimonetes bacterium]|nr:ABC transporter permease [Candidatus Cloacimonadota bacterium]
MSVVQKEKSGPDFFFNYLIKVIRAVFVIRSNRDISTAVILKQILFTGFEALPIISFIALAVGGLIILQGYNLLSNFGQGIWVHVILVTVVIRELSAIITALVVIARSGTAISTELGNMVVNREIDLLRSFGISPLSYLVASRIIGVMAAMIILTLYFNIIAVLGGWLFSTIFNRIEFRAFINDFMSVLHFSDIFVTLLKPLIFGFIIAIISSFQGLQVQMASTEVPQRTIRAVVQSIFVIIIADVLITMLFYYLS